MLNERKHKSKWNGPHHHQAVQYIIQSHRSVEWEVKWKMYIFDLQICFSYLWEMEWNICNAPFILYVRMCALCIFIYIYWTTMYCDSVALHTSHNHRIIWYGAVRVRARRSGRTRLGWQKKMAQSMCISVLMYRRYTHLWHFLALSLNKMCDMEWWWRRKS